MIARIGATLMLLAIPLILGFLTAGFVVTPAPWPLTAAYGIFAVGLTCLAGSICWHDVWNR